MDWTLSFAIFVVANIALCEGDFFDTCDNAVNLNIGYSTQITSYGFPTVGFQPQSSCRYTIRSPGEYQVQAVCDISMTNDSQCLNQRFYVNRTGDPNLSNADYYCGNQRITVLSTGNTLMLAYISLKNSGTWNCTLTPACDCGWNVNTRIVGGSDAKPTEFPPMATLYNPSVTRNFCGATIVSSYWVLTAAHCLSKYSLSDTQVGVGIYQTNVTNEYTRYYQIYQAVKHPDYQVGQDYNDLAMIQVYGPIKYSLMVAPVCLPILYPTFDFSGFTVQATGFGTTSFGGPFSVTLRKVNLQIQTNAQCTTAYNNKKTINSSQMCTFGGVNQDACQFDSGGPLFYRSGDSRLFNLGVISLGEGCGSSKPGVNSRTTSFLQWIESLTGPLCRRPIN